MTSNPFNSLAIALTPVILALSIILGPAGNSRADVVATAEVPNGETNFPGIIQWSLNYPGDSPDFFEIDISEGMTGHEIVTSMESEVEPGFPAVVSGNQLTISGALGNLGICPGEVDMTWEVIVPPGEAISHPNFPLVNASLPGDYPSLSLFIAGPDGTSVPVAGDGTSQHFFTVEIVEGRGWSAEIDIPFNSNMTTDDLNRAMDAQLRDLRLIDGLSYTGLNNGFPTFSATNGFRSFSVRTTVRSDEDPGFMVGFIAQGALPVCPRNGTLVEGVGEIGSVEVVCGSDDRYWAAHGATFAYAVTDPVVQYEIEAIAPTGFDNGALSIDVEASKESNEAALNLRVSLFDFVRNRYVALPGIFPLSTTDKIQNFPLPAGANANDFVRPGSNQVRLLIQTIQTAGRPNVRTQLDEVLINFN